MKVRLSTHAIIRLEQRGIDIDKIKKVIREPDFEDIQDSGKIKAQKIIEARLIRVVYSKNKNVFVIITAI